jgi:hypothetical protein
LRWRTENSVEEEAYMDILKGKYMWKAQRGTIRWKRCGELKFEWKGKNRVRVSEGERGNG